MDLMRLDEDTFQPVDLIEGYSSLIWTERYTPAGEIELHTPLIEETRELLPEGSLVCIRESDEVMEIETSDIAVNDEGTDELVVKGRTLETFLEKRLFIGDFGSGWESWQSYTVQDITSLIMWNSLVNSTTVDVTGSGHTHDPDDRVPNVVISQNIHLQETRVEPVDDESGEVSDLQKIQIWYMDTGEVYPKLLDWLNMGKLGIRLIRPTSSGTVVAVATADSIFTVPAVHKGDIIYSSPSNMAELRFEIYNGRNRSTTPSTLDPLDPVIFRYDAGHIASPKYLFSNKDYRSHMHVANSDGEIDVWDMNSWVYSGPGSPHPPRGLQRRSVLFNPNTSDASDTNLYLTQQGEAELKKKTRISLVDGEIAHSPFVYGTDYYLGDTVTIQGQFGIRMDMQVAEYVRTESEAGEIAYPTLERKEA